MGSVLSAWPNSAKLTIMVAIVATLGHSLVKPSVYFRPIAQPTSLNPANAKNTQAIGGLLSMK
ncbi:hypothetical protein D3C78_1914510 [compost metagenome]